MAYSRKPNMSKYLLVLNPKLADQKRFQENLNKEEILSEHLKNINNIFLKKTKLKNLLFLRNRDFLVANRKSSPNN